MMDRSDVIKLIKTTYISDEIGQRIPQESERQIFCNVKSISRTEWFEAGKSGLKPAFCFEIFPPEYDNEIIVEYKGTRYGIYRTYRPTSEKMELYAEEKGGLKNGGKD